MYLFQNIEETSLGIIEQFINPNSSPPWYPIECPCKQHYEDATKERFHRVTNLMMLNGCIKPRLEHITLYNDYCPLGRFLSAKSFRQQILDVTYLCLSLINCLINLSILFSLIKSSKVAIGMIRLGHMALSG